MADEILYCNVCGNRIPPEEAEAEDFREEGGEPTCGVCLEKAHPERKRRVAEVRTTRLRMRAERRAAVNQAGAPQQTYPPPGTGRPLPPSGPDVTAVRRDLDEEDDEVTELDPAVAAEELKEHTLPAKSSPNLVWWGLLGFGLLSIVVLLCWPKVKPSDRHAEGTKGQPSVPETGAGLEQKKAPPPSPAPPLSEVQLALAEVELIKTQVGEWPEPAAAEVAIAKLKQIARITGEPARSAALDACARYEATLDVRARQKARDAAERAEDLVSQKLFSPAVEHLRSAVRALPSGSVWVQVKGREKLEALIGHWSEERRRQLSKCSARLESELAAGNAERVKLFIHELSTHPEKAFRDLALAYKNQLAAMREREAQKQREDQAAAHAAWPRFFAAYDTALAARDFTAAAKQCRPPAESPLRRGGVAQPGAVLAGFAEDVKRVQGLFPLALRAAAKRVGEKVRLRLRTGQVEGSIRGVENGQMVLVAGNSVEVRIAPEKLSSEALAVLLLDAPREAYGPGLAALRFAETPSEAEDRQAALAALYQEIGVPLPSCWAQRFEFERKGRWRSSVAPRLVALKKAVGEGRIRAIRDALAQLRPLLDGGTLSKQEDELVAAAKKMVGGGRILKLVLQNGRSPSPNFRGVQIDQLSAYYKDADQCDVGLHKGLRLGSINDLQRILIRFDGLSTHLGRGRLLKATLEFHQIDNRDSKGAVVALYPLKRAWTPDAGTWQQADRNRKQAWEKPGASGPTDADAQPVAQIVLDDQEDLWRSWDVTSYLRGVLEGRTPPYGLLMRIALDEPKHGVRFYPDGDVAPAPQDPALRPRLMIEFEKFGR